MSSESVSIVERSTTGPRTQGGLPSLTDIPAAGAKAWRFLLSWSLGWLLVGFSVALGITFSRRSFADFTPLLVCSVLFAEVVGFNALVCARLVFPYYDPTAPQPTTATRITPSPVPSRAGTSPCAAAPARRAARPRARGRR